MDELPVDDDAVDQAGDVRVEHVVREDAVGERVLVRPLRLAAACDCAVDWQPQGQRDCEKLPASIHD